MARELYSLAYDPDPDFTELVEPANLEIPELMQLPDGDEKNGALAQLHEISLKQAASRSGIKAEAALEAESYDWEIIQRQRTRRFLSATTEDYELIDRAGEKFVSEYSPLNPDEDQAYLDLLGTTGFTAELIGMLLAAGLDQTDIDSIAEALVDLGTGFGGSASYLPASTSLDARSTGETIALLYELEYAVRTSLFGHQIAAITDEERVHAVTETEAIDGLNAIGWQTRSGTSQAEGLLAFVDQLSDAKLDLDIVGLRRNANEAFSTVLSLPSDNVPPVSSSTLVGTLGERGWFVSDVQVSITATDAADFRTDGSGISSTHYRVNQGDWRVYGEPFFVTTESLDNIVEFYSTDVAGNVEATQNVHFHLDKTRPDISIGSGETDDIIWDQAHLQHGLLSNDGTLALTGNATDNLCLWEVRTVNAGSGLTTASQQPPNANVFPPPPPNSLGYSLNVPLHPGINTVDVTAEDCARWEDAVRIQVVYVVPGQFDPRTKGFWNEAVKTKKYTNAQISTFLSYINVASDVWGNDASRNRYGPLTLANYKTILGVPESANMEKKMQAQLLADWLNMVSGRLAVKKAVNVSPVSGWPTVMDDIAGNPLTFAYKVALEIEEKVQPAPAPVAINTVAKNLAEGLNLKTIIVP